MPIRITDLFADDLMDAGLPSIRNNKEAKVALLKVMELVADGLGNERCYTIKLSA